MSDNAAIEKTVRQVLGARGVAVLATQGEEYPHVCLVAFAVTDDLEQIVFATSRTTRKYGNIQKNDRVTILVDTRANNEEDFHEAAAVSARGRTEEPAGEEAGTLKALFLDRHPYLAPFLQAPTTALLRIKIRTYSVVSRFQNVLLLDMDRDASP